MGRPDGQDEMKLPAGRKENRALLRAAAGFLFIHSKQSKLGEYNKKRSPNKAEKTISKQIKLTPETGCPHKCSGQLGWVSQRLPRAKMNCCKSICTRPGQQQCSNYMAIFQSEWRKNESSLTICLDGLRFVAKKKNIREQMCSSIIATKIDIHLKKKLKKCIKVCNKLYRIQIQCKIYGLVFCSILLDSISGDFRSKSISVASLYIF